MIPIITTHLSVCFVSDVYDEFDIFFYTPLARVNLPERARGGWGQKNVSYRMNQINKHSHAILETHWYNENPVRITVGKQAQTLSKPAMPLCSMKRTLYS